MPSTNGLRPGPRLRLIYFASAHRYRIERLTWVTAYKSKTRYYAVSPYDARFLSDLLGVWIDVFDPDAGQYAEVQWTP